MGKYTEWILKELENLKHLNTENQIATVAKNLSLIYDIPIEIAVLAVKAIVQENMNSQPNFMNHFFNGILYYL